LCKAILYRLEPLERGESRSSGGAGHQALALGLMLIIHHLIALLDAAGYAPQPFLVNIKSTSPSHLAQPSFVNIKSTSPSHLGSDFEPTASLQLNTLSARPSDTKKRTPELDDRFGVLRMIAANPDFPSLSQGPLLVVIFFKLCEIARLARLFCRAKITYAQVWYSSKPRRSTA